MLFFPVFVSDDNSYLEHPRKVANSGWAALCPSFAFCNGRATIRGPAPIEARKPPTDNFRYAEVHKKVFCQRRRIISRFSVDRRSMCGRCMQHCRNLPGFYFQTLQCMLSAEVASRSREFPAVAREVLKLFRGLAVSGGGGGRKSGPLLS